MVFITPFVVKKNKNSLRVLALLAAIVCLIGTLSQTAQAENTYVITDGSSVMVHTTSASDPAVVLQEVGVALSAEDIYTTAPGDGVSEITVQRAQEITVHYGAEVQLVSSHGETLEALFTRLGISADETVRVSEPLDTETYDGMSVYIDRVQKRTEKYTVEVAFETVYRPDPTLAVGEKKLVIAGKTGQRLCTANVVYVNGCEESRTVYENTLIEEPVTQVIAFGTGESVNGALSEPVIGDGVILLPTGEVLTYTHSEQYTATAYSRNDDGCDGKTANGAQVKWGVVAVDPSVIPYGTRMFIVTNDGQYIYGLCTAEDCGGAIRQKRVDLYMESVAECMKFGVRSCTVYFLGDANWRDN